MMNFVRKVSPLAFVLLTACGGGGSSSSSSGSSTLVEYDGATTAATISDTNKSALAGSSSEVVTLAIESENSGDSLGNLPVGIQAQSIDQDVLKKAKELVLSIDNAVLAGLPVGAESSVDGTCGGSASLSGDESNMTMVFSNFCINEDGYQMTFNGKANIKTSTNGSVKRLTITYTNFRMSGMGETFTISGTQVTEVNTATELETYSSWNVSVTANGETIRSAGSVTCTAEDVCSFTEQFEAQNGDTYQVKDLSVSGDSSSGYSVSATFYDPDFGYVELTASNIILCADGSIASGSITLTDEAGNVLSVTFNGCGQEATVDLNGAAELLVQ